MIKIDYKRKKLKEYQVKVSLSYNAIINVRADSKKHAVDIVETELEQPDKIKCGVEIGSINPHDYGIVMESETELNIDKKRTHIR